MIPRITLCISRAPPCVADPAFRTLSATNPRLSSIRSSAIPKGSTFACVTSGSGSCR